MMDFLIVIGCFLFIATALYWVIKLIVWIDFKINKLDKVEWFDID